MLETAEQIRVTLEQCGETLSFDNVDILGIPGTLVYNVPSYDSPYDLEKQDYSFQISLADFIDNEIHNTDIFIYYLLGTEYKFKLISYTNDLLGWVELSTQFQGVTPI
jgi:hypothetical protein